MNKSKIKTSQQKIKIIESLFGNGITSNDGTNISVTCPVCKKDSKSGSKKKKLAIVIDSGVYHCWVCESKGRNISYIAKRHVNVSKELLNKVYEIFHFKETKKEIEEEKIRIALPSDFELLAFSKGRYASYAKKYLRERGLSLDDLIKFKIGISSNNEFNNRVIFPSHCDNMELNFYLSRTFDDTTFRKYKNCEAKRKDIIYNEYLIDWQKPVILTEGIFDAIKAGKNAVPMLGSWIDEDYYLFRKLVVNNSDVILCLDPDAKDKEIKIAEKLSEYGNNVYLLPYHKSDLGDMSYSEASEAINKAKLFEQSDRMEYLIQSIRSGSIF